MSEDDYYASLGIWVRRQFGIGFQVSEHACYPLDDQIIVITRELNRDDGWKSWWAASSKVPRLVIGIYVYDATLPERDLSARSENVIRARTREHYVHLLVPSQDLVGADVARCRDMAVELVTKAISRISAKCKFSDPPASLPPLPDLAAPVWPDP